MRIPRLTIAICSVLIPFLAAFSQAPPEQGLTSNPLYQKKCEKCHGKTAEGHHFGGPSLITAKVAAASSEDLHNIITNGKGHMPKFAGKLTSQDIDALVKQIQALNQK